MIIIERGGQVVVAGRARVWEGRNVDRGRYGGLFTRPTPFYVRPVIVFESLFPCFSNGSVYVMFDLGARPIHVCFQVDRNSLKNEEVKTREGRFQARALLVLMLVLAFVKDLSRRLPFRCLPTPFNIHTASRPSNMVTYLFHPEAKRG